MPLAHLELEGYPAGHCIGGDSLWPSQLNDCHYSVRPLVYSRIGEFLPSPVDGRDAEASAGWNRIRIGVSNITDFRRSHVHSSRNFP